GAFPGMWQTPVGIASDGSAFFVTDQYNHRVVRVDPRGETLDQWGQHAVKPREGNGCQSERPSSGPLTSA
ncbi:hypothetical protein EBT31_18950, partial [bacterium]|nr:hypothetical protein [bacterium]